MTKLQNAIVSSFLIVLLGISYLLYDLILEVRELKAIQKGILIASATPQSDSQNHQFWLFAVIVGFITLFWNPIYHKVFERLIEYIVNKIVSLEWKFETLSFKWYLSLFWTHFPGKGKMEVQDILMSDYHSLLFEFYKLLRKFNIFSGKSGGIGYKVQFKTDTSVNAAKYLQSMYETAKQILPESTHKKLADINNFYGSFVYGEIGIAPMFLIQMSFLSATKKLNREQVREFLETAFEYFVRIKAQTDSDVTDNQINVLRRAFVLTASEHEAAFIDQAWEKYKTDKSGTLISIIIQQAPKS